MNKPARHIIMKINQINNYYKYLIMSKLSDIGLIGLAVMGENLVLNMESKGFQVSVFNRSTQKVDDFLAGRAKGKKYYWHSFY